MNLLYEASFMNDEEISLLVDYLIEKDRLDEIFTDSAYTIASRMPLGSN